MFIAQEEAQGYLHDHAFILISYYAIFIYSFFLFCLQNVNTHDTLVFTLCTEIMAFPESAWTKVLVRCLNQLHLTPGNFSTLRQVGVLAGKMLKVRLLLFECKQLF